MNLKTSFLNPRSLILPGFRDVLFLGILVASPTFALMSEAAQASEARDLVLSQAQPAPKQNSITSQFSVLYVNPQSGQDSGDGTEAMPVRTIAQALRLAGPNTVVKLAPGTYSAQSGESFPIEMKPSVTLQGEVSDRGQTVIIQGSGEFLSKTFARQQVTLIGANRAGLQGVTVTNPHPQGYGIWIESSSPAISDSTFTGNGHDGISIVGNSAPIVVNNYFYNNGANGLTVYGSSRPEIKENIFEKTGFGINIAQNAVPRLIGNRVTQNKDGIVVQGNAMPILRGNVIDGNSRDGLVAIGASRPDLGTMGDQGNNTFLNNGGLDINAKATVQVVPVVGNQFARTSGRVDAAASIAASVAQIQPAVIQAQPVQVQSVQAQPVQAQPVQAQPIAAIAQPASIAVPTEISATASPQEFTFSRPEVVAPAAVAKSPVISTPAIPTGMPRQAGALTSVAQPAGQLMNQPLAFTTPPIAVQPGTGSRSLPLPKQAATRAPIPTSMTFNNLILPTQGQPAVNAIPGAIPKPSNALLPVPGSNIPLGNVGELSSVPVWRQSGRRAAAAPIAQPRTTAKFRVIVEMGDAEKLRSVIPGAFTAFSGGREVMQAGAFGDQTKASQLLQRLNSQGISGVVESF